MTPVEVFGTEAAPAGLRTEAPLEHAPPSRPEPTWDAYARTDVVDLGEGDAATRVIFTDGGGAAVMPRFRRTIRDAERVMADAGMLPYYRGAKDRVLQKDPAALRDPSRVMYPLLTLRDTPYSEAEAEQAFTLGVSAGLVPLFVPGVHEFPVFRALARGEQSLQAFVATFSARVNPTTDDSPFFYEYSRPLPAHLLWLLGGVAVLLLLVVGLAGNVGKRGARPWGRWSPVAYFAALGGAFMLVEIPALQRGIFALGYPTLAFSVVLFALLTGAGIGSYLSAWLPDRDLKRGMARASLLAGLLAAVWLWGTPLLLKRWPEAGLLSRSLLAMGLLLPLGFSMGIPFPLGIRLLKREGQEAVVPWMWAVNGVVSVVASVGAVAAAIVAGFSWAMAVGAVLYLAAAGFARFGFWERDSPASLGPEAWMACGSGEAPSAGSFHLTKG